MQIPLVMMVKSVQCGAVDSTAGTGAEDARKSGESTPEARILRWKISAYPARALMPSWIRAPPESLRPMTGAPIFMARSMYLADLQGPLSRERTAITQ